ncbi:tetratricopeptide repeat protein [Sphingomonas bacterium]|uniref:tetratricopeptide repeat protein n=1 Tax=Sphingomonas bacterium TaxID=1895847 RepID=UPI002633D98F|nr:tetratricopeptide repeat protein [Sphingomonas bacterium]
MRKLVLMAVIAGGLVVAAPVDAQNAGASLDARVTQVEKRLNTVERVLSRTSGGAPMVQPDIGPPDGSVAAAGTPATAPLTDLQARVASVEGEVSGLTNRVETAEHRLQQLDMDFAAYKKATDARLRALEDGRATADAPAALSDGPAPVRPARPAATTPKPAAAADPGRADRLAAVPKPTGADAPDKGTYAYNYGYRLWKAGLYPEAEAQFDKYATRFPKHRLVSRAQNVLGLVYLDDGKPKEAAEIFYTNYSKLPDGDRASDSLLNLARALTALKRPAADVCQVYKELGDVYGDKLTPAQRADADKGRATYKCK